MSDNPIYDFAVDLPRMTILSDAALSHTTPQSDTLELIDRLGPVYDILRHRSTQAPMAIAIYGDWGAGKSSAMRWLQGQLAEWNTFWKKKRPSSRKRKGPIHRIVRTVWFDPWKYQTREEVWRGLIAEVILHCIDVNQLDRSNAPKRILSAAKQFGPFLGRSFLHALSNLTVKAKTPVAEAELKGSLIREIYDEYRQAAHPEKAYLNDFEETLRSWIGQSIPADTERMVVFIDDLDRCLPEVALEVLEALKLYLAIPNLIFVVGVDPRVIDSLVRTYYDKYGLSYGKSGRYLEKMFQVEVTVSPSELQVDAFFDHCLEQINVQTDDFWNKMLVDDDSSWGEVIHSVIRRLCYDNPREVKRLLNSTLIHARSAVQIDRDAEDYDESLRFAQGAQIFLIAKTLGHDGEALLRKNRGQQFFEEFSKLVRENPNAVPPTFEPEPVAEDDEERERQDKWSHEHFKVRTGETDPTFDAFYKKWSEETDARMVRRCMRNLTVRELMRIPFNPNVAAHASVISSDGPGTIDIAKMPETIAKAVAEQAEKPVEALTSDDYSQVTRLDLLGTSIQDVGPLSALPQLQVLSLNGTQVSDVGPLSALTQLQGLDLSRTQVSDVGPLSALTQLQVLDLDGTQVSDVGPLSALTQLQRLNLEGTQVSGVGPLSALTQLQWLDLDRTQVSDVGPLSALTQLQVLSLAETQVSDVGPLSALTQLQGLYLNGTQVSDVGPLAKLKKLKTLDLRRTNVTKEQVAELEKALPECTIVSN